MKVGDLVIVNNSMFDLFDDNKAYGIITKFDHEWFFDRPTVWVLMQTGVHDWVFKKDVELV
jgi:hypothetical protein